MLGSLNRVSVLVSVVASTFFIVGVAVLRTVGVAEYISDDDTEFIEEDEFDDSEDSEDSEETDDDQ